MDEGSGRAARCKATGLEIAVHRLSPVIACYIKLRKPSLTSKSGQSQDISQLLTGDAFEHISPLVRWSPSTRLASSKGYSTYAVSTHQCKLLIRRVLPSLPSFTPRGIAANIDERLGFLILPLCRTFVLTLAF